jgi:hypothetical protein
MEELDFLKHLKHKLEECGLEDTYLNDILKCRNVIDNRIRQVKKIPIDSVTQQSEPCSGNCGMNYCDDNGCIERKRILVEPTDLPVHGE